MKVVSFNEVKEELISNMRRNMLIPIIGSGFTRQCTSRKGEVPSGEDYRKHMIAEILKAIPLSEADQENLNKETFSNVSSIYHEHIDCETQKTFLRDNFTKVSIEENKKRFLSLPWPYIYTLNIDDGIECGSDYNHIIYANRSLIRIFLIMKSVSSSCMVMLQTCLLIWTQKVRCFPKNSMYQA